MEWHSWYLLLLIPIIRSLVKSFQQSSKKEISLDSTQANRNGTNEANAGKMNSVSAGFSVNKQIVELINELNYVLISNKVNEQLDYEIVLKNYENKFLDLKRQATIMKIQGNDQSKELSYSTWSDRYEYGQNSHNSEIAEDFIERLKARLK